MNENYKNNLINNVKRICKEQKKQFKDIAIIANMDPSGVTRSLYGNARIDTLIKIANALNVPISTLFEDCEDKNIEGFVKINKEVYVFKSKQELSELLNN